MQIRGPEIIGDDCGSSRAKKWNLFLAKGARWGSSQKKGLQPCRCTVPSGESGSAHDRAKCLQKMNGPISRDRAKAHMPCVSRASQPQPGTIRFAVWLGLRGTRSASNVGEPNLIVAPQWENIYKSVEVGSSTQPARDLPVWMMTSAGHIDGRVWAAHRRSQSCGLWSGALARDRGVLAASCSCEFHGHSARFFALRTQMLKMVTAAQGSIRLSRDHGGHKDGVQGLR